METVEVENGDTVIVKNENTTIGYATFDSTKRELTYLFVNPAFRRQGYGKLLKRKAEQTSGCSLSPSDPILLWDKVLQYNNGSLIGNS